MVWPALAPPCALATTSYCWARMSTSLPLPSSPHWVPRTTAICGSNGSCAVTAVADGGEGVWCLGEKGRWREGRKGVGCSRHCLLVMAFGRAIPWVAAIGKDDSLPLVLIVLNFIGCNVVCETNKKRLPTKL